VPENLEEETACVFSPESKVQFNLRECKKNFCTGIFEKMATKIVIKTVNFTKNMHYSPY
jgi:hypothetical protein